MQQPDGAIDLRCSCCGREKMGRLYPDRLEVRDRRHGKKHVLVLNLTHLIAVWQAQNIAAAGPPQPAEELPRAVGAK